jgi:hypothetical protein
MGIILIRNDRFAIAAAQQFQQSINFLPSQPDGTPPLPDFLMLIGPSASIFTLSHITSVSKYSALRIGAAAAMM